MIVIVDYGMGNLGSIKNMLRRLGYESAISSDKLIIEKANKLILPGVGAFDTGIRNLEEKGLIEILNKKVLIEKVPVLGICLGAQLMCKSSEEGIKTGLSWFDAEVHSFNNTFDKGNKLPVPNMGWIDVEIKNENELTRNLLTNSRFYFVHSYFIKSKNQNNVMFSSDYGFTYVSGLFRENIYGVQFHPEKSHKFGFKLLQNFAEI